jgi:hypothetical protein
MEMPNVSFCWSISKPCQKADGQCPHFIAMNLAIFKKAGDSPAIKASILQNVLRIVRLITPSSAYTPLMHTGVHACVCGSKGAKQIRVSFNLRLSVGMYAQLLLAKKRRR